MLRLIISTTIISLGTTTITMLTVAIIIIKAILPLPRDRRGVPGACEDSGDHLAGPVRGVLLTEILLPRVARQGT